MVRRRFGVDYTLAGMDLVLHRIGWSVQVPARRAGERDEARIAAWREETWPAVNGRRRTWPLWSHLKRSLANLAKRNLAQLTALVKTRLKRMQYRPALLEGFLASTGLDLHPAVTPTIRDL